MPGDTWIVTIDDREVWQLPLGRDRAGLTSANCADGLRLHYKGVSGMPSSKVKSSLSTGVPDGTGSAGKRSDST